MYVSFPIGRLDGLGGPVDMSNLVLAKAGDRGPLISDGNHSDASKSRPTRWEIQLL